MQLGFLYVRSKAEGDTMVGFEVSMLAVDGKAANVSWSSLPLNRWMHVYIEGAYAFDDDINLMSGAITGDRTGAAEHLKGRLASVGPP